MVSLTNTKCVTTYIPTKICIILTLLVLKMCKFGIEYGAFISVRLIRLKYHHSAVLARFRLLVMLNFY